MKINKKVRFLCVRADKGQAIILQELEKQNEWGSGSCPCGKFGRMIDLSGNYCGVCDTAENDNRIEVTMEEYIAIIIKKDKVEVSEDEIKAGDHVILGPFGRHEHPCFMECMEQHVGKVVKVMSTHSSHKEEVFRACGWGWTHSSATKLDLKTPSQIGDLDVTFTDNTVTIGCKSFTEDQIDLFARLLGEDEVCLTINGTPITQNMALDLLSDMKTIREAVSK